MLNSKIIGFVAIIFGICPLPTQAQQATSYTYDALGQLVNVLQSGGPADGASIAYNYDAAGNRTSYVSTIGALLSISAAAANEGMPLSYTITRAGVSTSAVTVNFATANGTAIGGTNYNASSGTVAFAAGVTSQNITITTIDDHIYTGNLSMTVNLSSPSSGASIANGSGLGTINNIEAQTQSSLAIASASANEGLPLSFIVSRTGASGAAVSAAYATSNGTAIAGTNFTGTSGIVSFGPGILTQTVVVATTSTTSQSANLSMSMTLSSPTGGASIGTASAIGTVIYVSPSWASTLTAGSRTICPRGACAYTTGYLAGSLGGLSTNTFNGYTITVLDNFHSDANPSPYTSFTLTGTATPSNTGWTSITIPGIGKLDRASATFSSTTTSGTWKWPGAYTVVNGTVTIQ